MSQMVYRTGNLENTRSLTRQMMLVMIAVMFGPFVVLFLVIGRHPSRANIINYTVIVSLVLFLLGGLSWLYGYAFRTLAFTVADRGLRIRFLNSTLIPWAEIQSVEKVQPFPIDLVRICGLAFNDFSQGLFSTRLGRARVWWAGEKEAAFLRTTKRNYLIAPENIDEFINLVEAHIRR